MKALEILLVLTGSGILVLGLRFSIHIVRILRRERLSRPWVILSLLISFFFFGYAFMTLRFANVQIFPFITNETVVAFVFFFGAIFVLALTYLNRSLFTNIFGQELTNAEAIEKFSKFIKLPPNFPKRSLLRKFTVTCDTCLNEITYSIPDIVRAHPRLSRGVRVEEGLGTKNYRFYLRHRCTKEHREIPVMHDHKLEYRSHGSSRLV